LNGGESPPLEPAEFRRPLIELLPPLGASLPAASPRYARAISLFFLSLFCTTTLGAVYVLQTRTDVMSDLDLVLTLRAIRTVWSDPWLLHQGLWFSLTALGILLVHELGHYFACLHYRLPVTLPYFLPSPIALGSFGAFIRIRAPLSDKRQLFDVGIAGPIAGFVALVPVLIWGAAHSRVVALGSIATGAQGSVLYLPGHPVAMQLALYAFHGAVPAGSVVELHPAALGAWFGLLATAINLLPFGQLDGGHVLYATFGRMQRRLARPLWVGLAALSFWSPSWILWTVITLAIGLRHPPVRDEETPLDARRKVLAVVALLILVLSFTPMPMRVIDLPAR
jgi:membrane-associated protease RseP (regulator of RpoE activity)